MGLHSTKQPFVINDVKTFEGFLYQTDQNQWVLCDAPHLKNCCLQQRTLVILDGDYSNYPAHTAIIAQGLFSDNTLSEVTIQEKNGSFPVWTVGAVFIVLICFGLFKRRKGRPLPP